MRKKGKIEIKRKGTIKKSKESFFGDAINGRFVSQLTKPFMNCECFNSIPSYYIYLLYSCNKMNET